MESPSLTFLCISRCLSPLGGNRTVPKAVREGHRGQPGSAEASAHMVISVPLAERRVWSSKRRRTLLLSASARRYGWFRRSAGGKRRWSACTAQQRHAQHCRHRACWKPVKAAWVATGGGSGPQQNSEQGLTGPKATHRAAGSAGVCSECRGR